MLNELTLPADARFEKDGRPKTILRELLWVEPPTERWSGDAYGCGTAGGGSDGGMLRVGSNPWRDHLRALVRELRLVLELDGCSPDASVDTDRSDGARERCSGVPNEKPTSPPPTASPPAPASVLFFRSRSAVKLTRRADSARGVFVPASETSSISIWLRANAVSLMPDIQRLRGGGCRDIAPAESPLVALSF